MLLCTCEYRGQAQSNRNSNPTENIEANYVETDEKMIKKLYGLK